MSYIHHIFDFIIFPFYAQYFQRFIYIFSKTYNPHLVILYISHNSFSKKGNEISPTPFVISYLFTIPLHLHPLIPPRHWLSLFLCNLTAVFIQTQKDRFPLLWYFWILLFRWQIVDSSMHELVESITSRSFFIHSERESHVTSAASFNTTNSISVSFNVMMLLLLRFFSFFLGAIVLLPFR